MGRPSCCLPAKQKKDPLCLCLNVWPRKKQRVLKTKKIIQLLAVDHSARASMKNAASCEN